MKNSLLLIALSLLVLSCSEDFTPKPKGFNHIPLPEHSYIVLSDTNSPYSFEYASIAKVYRDSLGYSDFKQHYKIIEYPEQLCKIHLTYKRIKGSIDTLNSYIGEGYRLLDGHDKKAYGFEEVYDTTDTGLNLALFELEGDVPSQVQFMVHDSTTNFVRGALYFEVATKNDSLAPVINYVREDIRHMLDTMEFKD